MDSASDNPSTNAPAVNQTGNQGELFSDKFTSQQRRDVIDELERGRLIVQQKERQAAADRLNKLRADREGELKALDALDMLEGRDCATMTPIEFSVVLTRAQQRHSNQ